MKNILFLISVLFSVSLNAQNGHDIKFDIENYNNDTLLLAYFYGDRQLVYDTIYSSEPGIFELKGDTLIHPGVYIGLVYPSKEYFQFLINNEDQEFELKTDYENPQNISVSGSKDNQLFINYLKFISEKNKEAQQLAKEKKEKEEAKSDLTVVEEKIKKLDEEVKAYQRKIIDNNPSSLTALLIKANTDIEIPDFEGTEEEIQLKRYYYYKKHYFDVVDFNNTAVLYTPFINNKVETYIDKLTVPVPDSIINSIDTILKKMPVQSEVWRYFVSYFLNKYARSNYIGMDAVYVHIAKEYYGKGLTPWVEQNTLVRILDNAMRMERVLIGKTAPNITLYTQDSIPVKIGDIEADYTVLIFWKPDCGHCKHAMPDIVKFAENYKDKGVKVVTICTKLGKKTKSCWEGVKDLNMENLDYNLADPKNLSGFHLEYNIRATPTIFILDKNKKILIKQIPADKLGEVIDKFIKENEKQNENEKK